MDCDGSEEKLAHCNYDGATGDCRHRPGFFVNGDAGLICYEEGLGKYKLVLYDWPIFC